jgi:hypothetical protein
MAAYHHYSEEDQEYAIANYNVIDNRVVAETLGVSVIALRRKVGVWKKEGFVFSLLSSGNPAELSSVTMRMVRGKWLPFIKSINGWRRLNPVKSGRKKGHQKTRSTKKKIINKIIKPKKVIVKKSKKEAVVFTIKPVDISDKMPIYIPEKRMVIYVRKGKDIVQVTNKFRQHCNLTPLQ